jgi:hypothetical protein
MPGGGKMDLPFETSSPGLAFDLFMGILWNGDARRYRPPEILDSSLPHDLPGLVAGVDLYSAAHLSALMPELQGEPGYGQGGRVFRDPQTGFLDDRDGRPARTRIRGEAQEDGYDFLDMTEWHVKGGVEIAEVHTNSVSDNEGSYLLVEWKRAGERHRDGGEPALINQSHHYIPEETYLDESIAEWWENGVMVRREDRTYDDIISTKPLSVRQAFGYDI